MTNTFDKELQASGAGEKFLFVHYHLFKNAGTSVDRALKQLFGDQWASFEAESGDQLLSPEAFMSRLLQRPELKAVSSHTARIAPWTLKELHAVPIVFVRHPIDRIKSAYEFERQQDAQTLGARLAKEMDFRAYVEHFIHKSKGRNFRNFQTFRISHASRRSELPEIEKALDAVDSFRFVGLVERYEESMSWLERIAREYLPDIKLPVVKANVGKRNGTLLERLSSIREELGVSLYSDVCNANLADMVLWERVNNRLALQAL